MRCKYTLPYMQQMFTGKPVNLTPFPMPMERFHVTRASETVSSAVNDQLFVVGFFRRRLSVVLLASVWRYQHIP